LIKTLLLALIALFGGSWNGKGKSGGFGGGWTPLGSDPTRQANFFFAISSRHFGKESHHLCSFILWNFIVRHVANQSRAVVEAISLDMPPCAHSNFLVPCRPMMSKGAQELLFPVFAGGEFELCGLRQIQDTVALAVFALAFLSSLAFFAFAAFVLAVCFLLLR
jgi:hypothetical protein